MVGQARNQTNQSIEMANTVGTFVICCNNGLAIITYINLQSWMSGNGSTALSDI